MYKAFDRVNYDASDFGCKTTGRGVQRPVAFNPDTLVEVCCLQINRNYDLIKEALVTIPTHVVPLLMKVAMSKGQPLAVAALVSHWPLPSLCFREIMSSEYSMQSHDSLFLEETGLDVILFQGVTSRKPTCMMTSLDLRGFKLHHSYVKLIARVWPLLSLKKKQLDTKKLLRHVITRAEISNKEMKESVLPEIVVKLLSKEVIHNLNFSIKLPKGKTLEVLVDNINFNEDGAFFLEYMVINSLRDITPLKVTPSTISIECDPRSEDEGVGQLGVFVNQEVEKLEGIGIRQLPDGVFNRVCRTIKRFTRVRAFDISDCGLYLQHGRTRNRTATRANIIETLHCFTSLVRLDLSENYVVGCLRELLAALATPLEYLNLQSCDLNHDDLVALTASRHATSLRELNLSKVTQRSMLAHGYVDAPFLVSSVVASAFPQLRVLNLSHNFLRTTALVNALCASLRAGSQRLRVLDFRENALSNDNQLEMSCACARITTMRWLRLTYYCNLSEELSSDLIDRNITNLQRRIDERLQRQGREDMTVDVSRLTYTVYLDLNM